MTTRFDSPEQAKAYVADCCGASLNDMTFTPIESLKLRQLGEDAILDDPEADADLKAAILARRDQQQAFRFQTPDGQEARIVIGPFRDGFDCWLVEPNGMGHRL